MGQKINSKITDKYSVLIVEDDKGLNKLIQNKLKRKGIDTIQAYTGAEGLKKAKKNKNILLLLDYVLPEIDGKKIVEKLRKEKEDRPFIIMTGHGDERLAVEMMKMGAKDYLVKSDEFLDLVPPVIIKALENIYHERKMEKMQEYNKYLSMVTRQIFEPIFVTDKNFKITFANDAAQKIYGFDEQEIKGRSIFDLYIEEDEEDLKSRIRKSLQEGYKWRKECKHTTESGETFTSIDSVSELQQDEQKGIIFFHYNIMERKKIEQEKEEMIQALQTNLERIKNSEDLIPMCSNCKKIRTQNDVWMELENYLREYTDLDLTHGICPACIKELYPDFSIPDKYSEEDNRGDRIDNPDSQIDLE